MDVDDLSEYFSNSVTINLNNPSSYRLYINNRRVYTEEYIPSNTVLGELNGKSTYIWEIKHNNYIIVDDELVLDIEDTKNNILNMVQEENCSNNVSNSYIYMYTKTNGDVHFFIITKEHIMPNQEIVYSANDFVNEYE